MNNTNNTLIVIPARYNSTRLPGKPLTMIAGKTLLQRVCEVAKQAATQISDVEILVATDDERIMQHAISLDIPAIMTPTDCATGTDRIIAAIQQLKSKPRSVINLQGDTPLTPINLITALLSALKTVDDNTIVTPVVQLSWTQLDSLRKTKLTGQFSGTTAILNRENKALWFSKQIIPALRTEAELRSKSDLSPVYQHLGLYGYPTKMLEIFASLAPSHYEQLEGLEQLRLLENGYQIQAVKVALENMAAWRGVDTPEDVKFVEQLLEDSK